MSRSIRFGVLGTGSMAQTMLATMRRSAGLEVVGIASRTVLRAQQVGARFAIARTYSSVDEMVADPAVGAIYIASVPALQAGATLTALAAGKAVLCEKPCATTPEMAERIAAAAAASGVLFMEAIATPFLPAVQHGLSVAKVGSLGAARHFAAEFGYPITPVSHPTCFAPEGGVLLDRAIHLAALARIALGPIASVEAIVRRNVDGIDTHASLLLDHDEGGTSQLTASFDMLLGNSATIGCERGAVTLQGPLLACERVKVTQAAVPTQRAVAHGGLRQRLKYVSTMRRVTAALGDRGGSSFHSYGDSPYAPELAHFCDLLRSGVAQSPILPPSLSVEVHRILAAARAGAAG